MVCLEPNYEVSPQQPPLPAPINDMTVYENSYAEKVMAIMRLPIALVMSIQRRSAVNNAQRVDDSDFLLVQRTLKEWQRILKNFFEHYYEEIYNTVDIEMFVRSVPFLDTYNLLLMFYQDIISPDALKRRVVEINNLDENDIANKPNIIRKVPLNGSEKHTTPNMLASLENIAMQNAEIDAKIKLMRAQESDIKNNSDANKEKALADSKQKNKAAKKLDVEATEIKKHGLPTGGDNKPAKKQKT